MKTLLLAFFLFFNLTDTIPAGARKLMQCYPQQITGFANNHIIFKDKREMTWDDGIRNKSRQQLLDHPDLNDMFAQPYPRGSINHPPPKDFDPGRIRNTAFFKKIYGETQQQVAQNLTEITWCPKLVHQKIRVTKVNGVDKQLQQISAELDEHPELKKYLTNIGGTFNWRNIAGTNRLSMHSFGMTIDINITFTDYWQWVCNCTAEDTVVPYRNRIPQPIVDIFERHGFIWGGRWAHFDTMHFEYRPELFD
jgi:hypothetical protein